MQPEWNVRAIKPQNAQHRQIKKQTQNMHPKISVRSAKMQE